MRLLMVSKGILEHSLFAVVVGLVDLGLFSSRFVRVR